MPTLYQMVNETGNRNQILEMCKFRISFRLGITSTTLYRFSPNFACSSEMWSLQWILFVRQTESSLPILEMCEFRFWQYSGFRDYIFQQIGILYWSSPNFACDSEMWSLRWLLFVRQTGSSLLILEMCGFRFWQYSGSRDYIFNR